MSVRMIFLPVMVSERLVDVTQDYIGEYVEIHGQFRSYNRHEEKHNRLVLSVNAPALYLYFIQQTEIAPNKYRTRNFRIIRRVFSFERAFRLKNTLRQQKETTPIIQTTKIIRTDINHIILNDTIYHP